MPSPLRVHYTFSLSPGDTPEQAAHRLAIEQTAELPLTVIPEAALAMAGRVVSVAEVDGSRFAAEIELPSDAAGADLGQLFTLLFGNASLLRGVRIERIDWPSDFLALHAGPRFGIAGLRALARVFDRPLLCGAAKPLGLSAHELALRCEALARGGLDLVKDDHGLADPPSAPWRERVARCQEAIERANAATGGHTLYVPHLAGPPSRLTERLAEARALGVRAVLVAPLPLGLGTVAHTVAEIAATNEVALIAHPSLAGAFFTADHGVAPEVLLGDLFRLAGCDGVIYPHEGGRFPLTPRDTAALRDHLRRPLGTLAPAFPVAAGGVDPEKISQLVAALGPDTILLLGTGLYLDAQPNGLERAATRAAQAVRALPRNPV